MKHLANEQFQLNIVYGDTNSIFVSGINNVEQNHYLAMSLQPPVSATLELMWIIKTHLLNVYCFAKSIT